MKRFENAKEGDKVYSILWGDSEIFSTCYNDIYPIGIRSKSNYKFICDLDGYEMKDHKEPTVFY